MNPINVHEEPIPGLGRRFDLELDDGHTLSVVVLHDGHHQLARRSTREDATDMLIDLDPDQAAIVGALLLGAHFSIASPDAARQDDRVIVDTITIAHDAPVIGKTAVEALHELSSDVVVLAVIRDQTPNIVEADPNLTLGSGDRVAIAARRRRHPAILRVLTGAVPPTATTR